MKKIGIRVMAILLIICISVSEDMISVVAEIIRENKGENILYRGDGGETGESIGADWFWSIDQNGVLRVSGDSKGCSFGFGWLQYSKYITSAIVDATNMGGMRYMFRGCSNLKSVKFSLASTQDIGTMESMFYGCSSLTSINLENFDTRNVEDMREMFSGCINLKSLDLSSFDTRNVKDMREMFSGCINLKSLDLSSFDTRNVKDMSEMFRDCSALKYLELKNFDTQNVKSMSGMFYGCNQMENVNVSNFRTQNVTDMWAMFDDCRKLENIDVSNFDTQNVIDMSYMFDECSGLASLDVSGFDTQNVIDMSYMFSECSGLTSLDVSGFDTQNVENMKCIFDECSGLTSLDVNSFDTQNVENMSYMFFGCSGLTNLDVSGFDTQNVKYMSGMFEGCNKLVDLDIRNFDLKNVLTMREMFRDCSEMKNVYFGRTNAQNLEDMAYMFYECTKLKELNLGDFSAKNIRNMTGMFNGCNALQILNLSNFGLLNIEWDYLSKHSSIFSLEDLKNLEVLIMPSQVPKFDVGMDLPKAGGVVGGYVWWNEYGEVCTEVVAELSESVKYIRLLEGEKPDIFEPEPGEIQTEKTIKINGSGSAYAKFYLYDKNKRRLRNTIFDYYILKDGKRFMYENKKTDENGAFIFPTLPIAEGESCDFEYTISLSDMSKKLYTDTYVVHAKATNLVYTEEWGLNFGKGISIGDIGGNKAKSRTITLKHNEDGTKDLEMSLQLSGEASIKKAEKLYKHTFENDVLKGSLTLNSVSISNKNKNNLKWTWLIKDYNEKSREDQKTVGKFLLMWIVLENSNDTILNQLIRQSSLGSRAIWKADSVGCAVELGVNSSLAVVDLKSDLVNTQIKLCPVVGSTEYSYNTKYDYLENKKEYSTGVSAESSSSLCSAGVLDALGFSGYKGMYELDSSSISASNDQIALTTECSSQKFDGWMGDKVSKVYTYKAGSDVAKQLKDKYDELRKLSVGKGKIWDVGIIRPMADNILKCNGIEIEELDKTKIKLSSKFFSPTIIEKVLSLGLSYSATRTTKVAVSGGMIEENGMYNTWKSVNDSSGISSSYAVTNLSDILDSAWKEVAEELISCLISEKGDTSQKFIENQKASVLTC